MTQPAIGTRSRPTTRELIADALIALFLTALSLLALGAGARDLGPSGPLNLGLLLLQTVPLALRRVAPIPVLIVIFGSIALQIATVPVGEDLRSSKRGFATRGRRIAGGPSSHACVNRPTTPGV